MSKDFAGGLLLLIVCGLLVFGGSDLEFGTPSEMGPGFLPFIAAGCLAVLSTGLMISGLVQAGPRIESLGLRPVAMVTLSAFAFAFLLHRVGILATTATVVVLCSFAMPGVRWSNVRWKEIAMLAVAMAAFVGVLFVHLLKLPIAL